jgi:hypothetical protein
MRVLRAFARAPARPRGAGPAQATASLSVGAGIYGTERSGERFRKSTTALWVGRCKSLTTGVERSIITQHVTPDSEDAMKEKVVILGGGGARTR